MGETRSRTPQPYGTVYEAVGELIDLLGGLEAAASLCSRSKSSLHTYMDRNSPGISAPIHVVLELEALCDKKPVTAFMAARANLAVIDLKSAAPNYDWLNHISQVSKEFADIVHETSKALSNQGDIDPVEAANILREIDEHMDALGKLRKAIEARRQDVDRRDASGQSVA
ncbi:MAG: hypothetical protein KAH11_10540 [Rhodospirillales bacterium]|nr:hypothetical protein [Rhodospirillales bacterium]